MRIQRVRSQKQHWKQDHLITMQYESMLTLLWEI